MAIDPIITGPSPGSTGGDILFDAFTKVNENFDYLESQLQIQQNKAESGPIQLSGLTSTLGLLGQITNATDEPIQILSDIQVKAYLALNNVDNTADDDKPVSTAVQLALMAKANVGHTHVIGDVTDLQTQLDSKATDSDLTLLTDRVELLEEKIVPYGLVAQIRPQGVVGSPVEDGIWESIGFSNQTFDISISRSFARITTPIETGVFVYKIFKSSASGFENYVNDEFSYLEEIGSITFASGSTTGTIAIDNDPNSVPLAPYQIEAGDQIIVLQESAPTITPANTDYDNPWMRILLSN